MYLTTLHQDMLFEKRIIELTEEGVNSYLKDKDGEFTNQISYDEFNGKILLSTSSKPRYLFCGIAIISFGIIRAVMFAKDIPLVMTVLGGAVTIAVGAVWLIFYYASMKKHHIIYMNEKNGLYINHRKPSHKAVQDFIQQFTENRKEFHRRKYFYVNGMEGRKEQIDRLSWLCEKNFISRTEYNTKLDELSSILKGNMQ